MPGVAGFVGGKIKQSIIATNDETAVNTFCLDTNPLYFLSFACQKKQTNLPTALQEPGILIHYLKANVLTPFLS